MYLREIGQYPLLTDKQEVELAQAIEGGERAKQRLAKEAAKMSARTVERVEQTSTPDARPAAGSSSPTSVSSSRSPAATRAWASRSST